MNDNKWAGWILAWAVLFGCATRAVADGKVFSRAIAVPVRTAGQRAMLHYSNGVERLVIETSFAGPGSNFAWVVPLPAQPSIDSVDPGFFERLAASFQPEVVHPGFMGWIPALVLGGMIGAALWVGRGSLLGACAVFGVEVVVCMAMAAVILPFFATATAKSGVSEGHGSVRVLDRSRAGIFETATIAGPDGKELTAWLDTNGFFIPPGAAPVISEYARRGWVFVTARIDPRAALKAPVQPHPLGFTFRTGEAVYPLRLTGIENGPCSIELYVLGGQAAMAEGFQAEHCGPAVFPEIQSQQPGWPWPEVSEVSLPRPGEYRVRNPEVRRWAGPARTVTKLVGTLSPRQMESDARLAWCPSPPVLPRVYSGTAVANLVLTWMTVIGIPGTLLVVVLKRWSLVPAPRWAVAVVWVVAVLAGAVRFSTLPATPVHVERGYAGGRYSAVKRLIWALHCLDPRRPQAGSSGRSRGPVTFQDVLADLKEQDITITTNVFTGEPLREGSSPGDLIVRQTDKAVQVVWHDIDGAPHPVVVVER